MQIRQALNVEAGLNDGLSVPFMLFFLALSACGTISGQSRLAQFIWEQLGLGTLIGMGIGLVSAMPGIQLYTKRIAGLEADAPELLATGGCAHDQRHQRPEIATEKLSLSRPVDSRVRLPR